MVRHSNNFYRMAPCAAYSMHTLSMCLSRMLLIPLMILCGVMRPNQGEVVHLEGKEGCVFRAGLPQPVAVVPWKCIFGIAPQLRAARRVQTIQVNSVG
jgi:hypothetical protein